MLQQREREERGLQVWVASQRDVAPPQPHHGAAHLPGQPGGGHVQLLQPGPGAGGPHLRLPLSRQGRPQVPNLCFRIVGVKICMGVSCPSLYIARHQCNSALDFKGVWFPRRRC